MSKDIKRVFLDENIIKLEHWQNAKTARSGYLKGLAMDCYQHPEADRNSHYFAREMLWTSRPKSAIKEFKRHIAMKKWPVERAQSMIFIGDAYGMLGQPEKQVEAYNKAFFTDSSRREPLLKLAMFYLHNKNYQSAICYAKAAMEIPWGSYYANQRTQYTNEPHEILYAAYGWLGNPDEAKKHIKKALAYQPTNNKYLRDLRFYFDLPTVTIILPTLGRPDKLKRCLEAIKKNANYPEDKIEIIVIHDGPEIDYESAKNFKLKEIDNRIIELNNKERLGVPKTVAVGLKESKNDLLMYLGNDCIPQPGFMIQAVWKMIETYPEMDGMVALNDGYWKGEVPTHFLISRKLMGYLNGEIFDTDFFHNGVDNLLGGRCRQINKYTWSELSQVYHDHPIQGDKFTDKQDSVHKIVQNQKNIEHDKALLEKKAKEFGFEVKKNFIHPSIKLSVVIPVKDKIEMTKACVKSIIDNTPSLGEILIIDDGSTDDYKSMETDMVKVIDNECEGVNGAWNTGINAAKFAYICVCNNDILVTKGWDKPLIDKLSAEIWMVSPFHTHGELPADFPNGTSKKNNMDGNTTGLPFLGSCYMLSKYAWSKIGPIDSRLKTWCGDNYLFEIITRMYGRKVVEVSDSYIHHFGSQTVTKDDINANKQADKAMFNKISEENKWRNVNLEYPWIPSMCDLRLRLPMLKLKDLKVLNVGVGPMDSALARQLPFLNFGQLDFIDIHKPYLDNAKKMTWLSPVTFKEQSISDCDFEEYDLILVFDVFEHLVKEESIRIIEKIKKLNKRLIVFGPLELKYRENVFGAESQDHLSLWTEQDFKDLGFATELIKDFHGDGGKSPNWNAAWAIL